MNISIYIDGNRTQPKPPENDESYAETNQPEGMHIVLHCIVFIHLYSASCSAHQSEALHMHVSYKSINKA